MYGKSKGLWYDLSGTFDPRVTATAAFKGSTFRYVPAVGSPEILIKDDDGLTTNWISAGGGGGAYTASNLGAGTGVFSALVGSDFQFKSLVAGAGISISASATEITITNTGGGSVAGDPNTLGYFDATGTLTDNLNARFDGTLNAMALLTTPGTANVFGQSALAHYRGDGTEIVSQAGTGTVVRGYFTTNTIITCATSGSVVSGFANGGSIMTASTGSGASAFGAATNLANMTATATGASVRGAASNSGSISAATIGSQAFGAANLSAQINAGSGGTFGSVAFGSVSNIAAITSSGSGSLAHGSGSDAGSSILASNDGAHAHGVISNAGRVRSTGLASHAHGNADTYQILASGRGAFAGGTALVGDLVASAESSFTYGDANTVSAFYAQGLGLGHSNSSYACLMVGRYGVTTGATTNLWVATDPVFVVGNGTGAGTEAVGYKIDKDGRVQTTAAERNTAVRSVSADTTLSARIDRVLYVNTSLAVANVNVTFPAGEDGLEFWVKDSGGNATARNILFVPTGGDVVEASADITNDRGARHFQYYSGTWFILNLP